jgi:hypothetical protein
MSYTSGRFLVGFILMISGVTSIAIAIILALTPFANEAAFIILQYVLSFSGVVEVAIGYILHSRGRRESREVNQILEIVAVERQATFSEISERTGLEPEYIRDIIIKFLRSNSLFGYIEDDTFYRDIADRPSRREESGMGVF